jgi:gluconate kinase
MKRSAAQYAVLSPLLDEVIPLDDAARAAWLAQLPDEYASYRPALDRILAIESATSKRKLNNLEVRLRSCSHGVRVLVLAEFDRRR